MQVLINSDCHIGAADLDGHFVVETELFGAFTEPSHHLEIEEGYGIVIDYLLLLLEANRVRHPSSSFDDLVNHIVSDGAVLETDDVYYTI